MKKDFERLQSEHLELKIRFNYLLDILGVIIDRDINGGLFFIPIGEDNAIKKALTQKKENEYIKIL